MANIQQTTNEQCETESALRRIAGMSARERQVFDGLLAGGTYKTIGQAGYQSAHGGNASRQRHGAARRPHLVRSRAEGGGWHPPAARARSNAFR
jgi:FixJ family two-component response regulator